MKNKIIVLLTILLFISCSGVNTREVNTEKRYEILLDNWKLDELNILLSDSAESDENRITAKYKILLQERIKEKSDLENMIETLKTQLKSNNFENIEMFFNDSFKNRKILSELENIDFSQMRILTTEPEFYKNTASNIAGIIFNDEVEYFRFYYKLSNKKWSIIEVKSGR